MRDCIHCTALFAALVASLGAEDLKSVGIQVRASAPSDSVAEATGRKASVGLSIHYEIDFEDGWRWRVGAGGDQWGYGKWDNRPGWQGQVTTTYLEVEGVKFLQPDTGAYLRGPYVGAGIRGVSWQVSSKNLELDLRSSRRTTHLAASLALGYRVFSWLDAEARFWYGHADTDFRGGAYSFGVTFRF